MAVCILKIFQKGGSEQTGLEGLYIVENGHDTNWVCKFIKDYTITSTGQFPTSAQS